MECFEELQWDIENFNFWNVQVHGTLIRSPPFGSIAFNLYPMGQNGRGKCMFINIFSNHPPGELSILNSDETVLSSQQVPYPKHGKKITVRGPELEKVLTFTKKEGRLTLRYRCNNVYAYKRILCTVIEVIDMTFKIDPDALVNGHRISDFVYDDQKRDYLVRLNSGKMGSGAGLVLSKSGIVNRVISVRTCVNFLKFGDVLEECQQNEHVFYDQNPWMFFSIGIEELKDKGEAILLHLRVINGEIGPSYWGTDLFTKRACAVPNTCKCLSEGEPSQVNSTEPSPMVPSKPLDPLTTLDQTDDSVTVLKKDFMCVFQDQDFSDFELKCGGVSLPVHKVILSARSPVFKRLLSSDMREAASGSVDIEDLDAPTLARFLAFLYTGAVGEDLHAESALKLFYAADKYEVSTLKKECVKCLCTDMSPRNVCDILSLADKHGDDQLTEMSRSFISENYDEVLRSVEWKIFMKKEPLLAVETVTHLAQKNNVRKRDHQ